MKLWKKTLSVGLSLILCAGMVAPSFAATFADLQEAIDAELPPAAEPVDPPAAPEAPAEGETPAEPVQSTENGSLILNTDNHYGFGWNDDASRFGIEAWDEDGTRNVQLNEDVSKDESEEDPATGVTIETGKDVTLDLNDHNISGDRNSSFGSEEYGSGDIITVEEGASLTVSGGDSENGNTIIGGTNGIVSAGDLTVKDVTIDRPVMSGIKVTGGTADIDNVKFWNGGLNVTGGDVTLGTIDGNRFFGAGTVIKDKAGNETVYVQSSHITWDGTFFYGEAVTKTTNEDGSVTVTRNTHSELGTGSGRRREYEVITVPAGADVEVALSKNGAVTLIYEDKEITCLGDSLYELNHFNEDGTVSGRSVIRSWDPSNPREVKVTTKAFDDTVSFETVVTLPEGCTADDIAVGAFVYVGATFPDGSMIGDAVYPFGVRISGYGGGYDPDRLVCLEGQGLVYDEEGNIVAVSSSSHGETVVHSITVVDPEKTEITNDRSDIVFTGELIIDGYVYPAGARVWSGGEIEDPCYDADGTVSWMGGLVILHVPDGTKAEINPETGAVNTPAGSWMKFRPESDIDITETWVIPYGDENVDVRFYGNQWYNSCIVIKLTEDNTGEGERFTVVTPGPSGNRTGTEYTIRLENDETDEITVVDGSFFIPEGGSIEPYDGPEFIYPNGAFIRVDGIYIPEGGKLAVPVYNEEDPSVEYTFPSGATMDEDGLYFDGPIIQKTEGEDEFGDCTMLAIAEVVEDDYESWLEPTAMFAIDPKDGDQPVTVKGDGSTVVPENDVITRVTYDEDGEEIYGEPISVPNGAIIDIEGNIISTVVEPKDDANGIVEIITTTIDTSDEETSITTTVIVPEGKQEEVKTSPESNTAIPAGSVANGKDGETICVGDCIIDKDGHINGKTVTKSEDNDGNVTIKTDNGEDGDDNKSTTTKITLPEGNTASDVKVDKDGNTTVPAGSKVTDKDGKEIDLPYGGTVDKDGNVKANPNPNAGNGGSTGSNTGVAGIAGIADEGLTTIEAEAVPLAGPVSVADVLGELYKHEGSPDGEDPEGEYDLAVAWAIANKIIDEDYDVEELVTVAILRDILTKYIDFAGIEYTLSIDGEDDDIVDNCGEILTELFAADA